MGKVPMGKPSKVGPGEVLGTHWHVVPARQEYATRLLEIFFQRFREDRMPGRRHILRHSRDDYDIFHFMHIVTKGYLSAIYSSDQKIP